MTNGDKVEIGLLWSTELTKNRSVADCSLPLSDSISLCVRSFQLFRSRHVNGSSLVFHDRQNITRHFSYSASMESLQFPPPTETEENESRIGLYGAEPQPSISPMSWSIYGAIDRSWGVVGGSRRAI